MLVLCFVNPSFSFFNLIISACYSFSDRFLCSCVFCFVLNFCMCSKLCNFSMIGIKFMHHCRVDISSENIFQNSHQTHVVLFME